MSTTSWIAFWWALFAGTHVLLSAVKVRRRLVAGLGDKGFLALYSLIAFATFIPLMMVYMGARHGGGLLWNLAASEGVRPLAIVLSAAGITLVVSGVVQPSPLLAGTKEARPARGLTRITRHPLFTGIALWALGHLLVNGSANGVLFYGGMLAFSLAGAAHQDARKRADERLGPFIAETSLLPFRAIIERRNRFVLEELPWPALAIGLAAAIAIYTQLHA